MSCSKKELQEYLQSSFLIKWALQHHRYVRISTASEASVSRATIGNILGLDHNYKAILIGAGNLGKAVAIHMSFEKRGFSLIGIFDNDPAKIGTTIRDLTVTDLDDLEKFCTENKTDAAIFCVPKTAVAAIAARLHALGVKNYWNFSHYDLTIDFDDIIVENVHLNDSLMILCYRISDANDAQHLSEDQ